MFALADLPRLNIRETIVKKLFSLFRRPSRSRPSLPTLPTQLLIQIFHQLNILDQACLALTCKSFHFIFNGVFENEVFRFPRLYQLRLPELEHNKFGGIRRQLLSRLEDRRVQYCVKCMKLHRRDAFAQPTYQGPMAYRESCWGNSGVVDLCPCVTLTIRDKGRVIRSLSRLPKGKKSMFLAGKSEGAFERAFVLGTHGRNQNSNPAMSAAPAPVPALIHECQISDHGFVAARIKTVLYIEENHMLVAETEYNVSTERGVMNWWPTEVFRDAHYNLLWAMRTAEMGLLLDGNSSGEGGRTLSVVRNLGSSQSLADGDWMRQDRLMSLSFIRLMHAYGL